MASPESLLAELGDHDPQIMEMIRQVNPLIISFDALATIDGWVIDLRNKAPGVSFDDVALHADQRAINALLVACDYTVRRGATGIEDAQRILRRESPIAIPDPSPLCNPLRRLVEALEICGDAPSAFRRRSRGHALSGEVRSDPALSFEQRSMDRNIGDNTSSSLTVHNESTSDKVVVVGEINERWAVEIGLSPTIELDQVVEIEREAPELPSFLHGITSYSYDDGIVVGWREGNTPDPRHLGIAIQAWSTALYDLPSVEVRIVFAPPTGESATLTEMRARGAALRLYRDAMRASADPT